MQEKVYLFWSKKGIDVMAHVGQSAGTLCKSPPVRRCHHCLCLCWSSSSALRMLVPKSREPLWPHVKRIANYLVRTDHLACEALSGAELINSELI